MKKFSQWKLLADLNISVKTVSYLHSLGIDIIRVDKSVSTDEAIVVLAKQQGRVILTFDKDFGEIYYFHKQKSITVIVLSVNDQTAEAINVLLERFFRDVPFEKVENKLVILYEGRYRLIG